MPRRRYDDKELRAKAIELRARGYTYKQISEALGCSTYKVWEVLSGYSEVRARVRQVFEASGRVDRLLERMRELEEWVSRVEEMGGKSLVEAVLELAKRVSAVERELYALRTLARVRVEKPFSCRNIDERGLCRVWRLRRRVEWLEVEEIDGGYSPVVTKQPLLCVSCPLYEPAKHSD